MYIVYRRQTLLSELQKQCKIIVAETRSLLQLYNKSKVRP